MNEQTKPINPAPCPTCGTVMTVMKNVYGFTVICPKCCADDDPTPAIVKMQEISKASFR